LKNKEKLIKMTLKIEQNIERMKKMAFKKIETMNEEVVHERACIILYGLSPKEAKLIQNVARLTGIKDHIGIGAEEEDTLVIDVLENRLGKKENPEVREKALLFNNIPHTQMNAMIEGIKKCRIQRPLIAVVTKTSIQWPLKRLLFNLVEERKAFQTGKMGEDDHQ
jgi:hypothetical protein